MSFAPSSHRSWFLWRRIDRYLLLHHPRLWATRLHVVVLLSAVSTSLAVLTAGLVHVSPDALPDLRSFFLSLVALSAIASLYWTWSQFRVLRHVSVRGPEGGGRTFLLNLLCLAAIFLAPLAATSFLRHRIAQEIPPDQAATDHRLFYEGLQTVNAYDSQGSQYSCIQTSDTASPRAFCRITPDPAVFLSGECTEWALQPQFRGNFECPNCAEASSRMLRFATLVERYGCTRAATNLFRLQIALALGVEEPALSRRHIFAIWFLSVTTSIILTIARTTSGRVLLETTAVLGCCWIALTFLSAAYDVHEGLSESLTLCICLLGALAAVVGRWMRPSAALLRLLVASCLLAPAATVAGGLSVFLKGHWPPGQTNIVGSLQQFAEPWGSLPEGAFVEVMAIGILVAFGLLMLYRPVAQRVAAVPGKR